ncbi:MAG: response regulator [Dysgonamonadaceae bacterium]|jgi:signal transduction histidine kinase/ligand-binding sensor domain-containing protein/DNA-binding response OmpR family regulator|nr:response regulator [Dysgonamonadaceae bacterium]
MKVLRILLSVISFFVVSITALSGNQYHFKTLSPEGGFYYDGVTHIRQDDEGFIWILMENNLYRFDGYQYKYYYNRFTDIDPSKKWLFRDMNVNSAGKLFVNTTNGLYAYDKISDTFYPIWDQFTEKFMIDAHDTIWIKCDNQWGILDVENKSVYVPLFDGKKAPHYIGSVYCLNNNDLYLFSNYGRLYRFNDSKKEFSLCMVLPQDDGYVLQATVHKGKLWALTRKYGLYKINLSSFEVEEHFDFYKEYETSSIRTFYIDKKGEIWLGTINGLYILNPETKEYTYYQHSQSDPYSLPNNSIWTITEDRQKNIWIGTYSGRICYVNLDEKNPFTTYFPLENGLNHTPVSAFLEDQQSLWIGTEGGGINRMDKQSGKFTDYICAGKMNGLSSNHIKSMVIDKKQNIWIATYGGGLNHYDPKNRRFNHLSQNVENNSLLSDDIKKIILEGDSGLWITYQLEKLIISFYSFKNKTFKHYNLSSDSGKLTFYNKRELSSGQYYNSYIFDIVRRKENQLWVLSREKIYLIDLKEQTMKSFKQEDTTFMNFSVFCSDDSGNLWIGTIGNGLVKYDPDLSLFKMYKEILSQGIFSVYSICNDDEGNVWMGTNNGLVRYNIADNVYSYYNKQDNTQGQVYYPLASMKGSNGNLYFGGTTGFTVINPKNSITNNYKPRIILSNFLINNVSADFHSFCGNLSGSEKEIVLDHNQTNFGFQFSSDNYLIPEKNRFKYRLKGYDDRWIESDAFNRTVLYSKVPPGVYYFEVIASNNDNVWSDDVTIVKIRCKPAPWFSWPAYLLYVLIVFSILYLILHYYNGKKKLQIRLYLENIEKMKKEEIHQTQLKFYTDISHDLKTPLSLILATLHKIEKKGQESSCYSIMKSNVHRLLRLINELMDFRTVVNGKMKLRLQPVDINQFVEKIAMDFQEYAVECGVYFGVKTTLSVDRPVYIDKIILEKIIVNLLDNAFKYAKEGACVSVGLLPDSAPFQSQYTNHYSIQSDDYVSGNTFGIVIRDTGIGIPEESLENIFERYFKIDMANSESKSGTGIGLALVKSFMLLHKGKLSIFSEKDRGTDVEIRFSTNEQVYDDSCFSYKEEVFPEKSLMTSLEKNNVNKLMKNEKKRILLVEDHNDLRNLIADILFEDYDVVEAKDGRDASEILENELIHLIISDIMMPNKDGLTLCTEVKSNIETSHIPVILLTAKTGIENEIEGISTGADIYIEKPVDLDLLKLTIRNIFSQQQNLKEYYSRNYFADDSELSSNEQDNKFLENLIQIVNDNLTQPQLDVNYIATQLMMSHSKLYNKVKLMTGKSVVNFILNLRLRKAARLIIEKDMSMRQVMEEVGIESQAYFTNAFKKEFGETPTKFATKHKKTGRPEEKGDHKKREIP